jgi:rare lipoprotein A
MKVKLRVPDNGQFLLSRPLLKIVISFSFFSVLISCGTSIERDGIPVEPVDVQSVPDAVPRVEKHSKYGNPESYVVFGKRYYVMKDSNGYKENGIASWYGKKFHGKRTSSGETYDMYAMTAAHKTLPLPTYVEVTNLENKRNVIVKVNDRGPFHDNRIIDLSYTAAVKLGIVANGTGLVEVHAIDPRNFQGRKSLARAVSIESGNLNGFYIQVGAFSQLINAERLQEKLGVLGDHLVRISQVVIGDKMLYRVRIGPLVDIDKADKIVARLTNLGINDHQIVID